MAQHRSGHKPLSGPMRALFTDAYMRHSSLNELMIQLTQQRKRNEEDKVNGLVQDCSNSIALAMKLLQSCTKAIEVILS